MELKLSDEQYEKIGNIGYKAYFSHRPMSDTKGRLVSAGRAAVDAVLAEVLPIVLAEPTIEELALAWDDAARRNDTSWPQLVKAAFKLRLARFTAPKDTAEDALFDLEVKGTREDGSVTHFKLCGSSIRKIVAAVRAADREAGR